VQPFDRNLLELLQSHLPLVAEPFAAIAEQLTCGEQAVLDRTRELRGPAGLIREIAGIFDAARLGYRQGLVAFRAGPERIDQAGAIVAGHPGVSHCYGRDGTYNLWFTLAASPLSSLGLAETAGLLARKCGASAHLVLPTLRRYKLDVRFSLGPEANSALAPAPAGEARDQADEGPDQTPAAPAPEQIRAIRGLQIDLPIRRGAFAGPARQVGLAAEALLAHGSDFLKTGWLRRYAAVLHHRAAGAKANVMVVWQVDESSADAAGASCAEAAEVSHCYLRPTGADWPYNLYTMIHGSDRAHCAAAIRRIAGETGLDDHLELWTAREYKKRRVRFFTEDEQQWESQNAEG